MTEGVYLTDGNPEIDALLLATSLACGSAKRVTASAVSLIDTFETALRSSVGVATAKKPSSSKYIKGAKYLLYRAQYNWSVNYFKQREKSIAVAWNGLTSSRFAFLNGAKDAGAGCLYLERAPFPGRVTVDHCGVNFLSSVPRSRSFFEEWGNQKGGCNMSDWRTVGESLVARKSRRSDVEQVKQSNLPDAPFLFFPLQVPNDTQIRQFSGWAGPVERQLLVLSEAARLLPQCWHLRVKEHPSSPVALTDFISELAKESDGKLVLDNQSDTFVQVAKSRGVVTVNSSVGLQAFFYDKPVLTLGWAFFAQEGLVNAATSKEDVFSVFTDPDILSFDPGFRDLFMSWLDQVYYPKYTVGDDGVAHIDAGILEAKVHAARRSAECAI